MTFFVDSNSKWLGKNCGLGDYSEQTLPAPWYKTDFELPRGISCQCAICGLGFYELYCNGKKVGSRLLDPVVSCYDKHVYYTVYDLSGFVQFGINTIGVVLGNGWYNSTPDDIWNFQKAPWRDYPKFRLEIRNTSTGELLLGSTEKWLTTTGPIVFDALRNGEFYDARLELPVDWCCPDSKTDEWQKAELTQPPGGIPVQCSAPPISLLETIQCSPCSLFGVYDAGESMAGHCRIKVQGKCGDKVQIRYSDRLDCDGKLDCQDHSRFVFSGVVQQDEYTLKGGGIELWEPRFVYHGFRYISVLPLQGEPEILNVEARKVGTVMQTHGNFTSSSTVLNKLSQCFVRSFRACFVGMPSDNPHREKNGWTGDAHLASDSGMYHFDGSHIYDNFLEMIRDFQRPSGQFPGILPCASWGYNWGNGPAWDLALFEIPWQIYCHTGEKTELKRCYSSMKKYCDYVQFMLSENLVSWGIGDHLPECPTVSAEYCSTACYQRILIIMRKTAMLLEDFEQANRIQKLISEQYDAFQKHYSKGDGLYANSEPTALALAVAFDLSSEPAKTAAALDRVMRENGCRAKFGVLGAKYVPRVLFEYGYSDTAYEILTQEQYPGWGYWIKQGATTLWERWHGGGSKNHVMFGDISAAMFRYLAGFRHDENFAGSRKLLLQPCFPQKLAEVDCNYCNYQIHWKRQDDVIQFRCTVPENGNASLKLNGEEHQLESGQYQFSIGGGTSDAN